MPGLRIITSNATEALVPRLAAREPGEGEDPFRPEVIVVQSRGMARWLQLELARRRGVSADLQFPFPTKFIQQVLTALVPEATSTAAFTPEVMAWRIADLFQRFRDQPAFQPVRHYLGRDGDPRRQFQLATHVAALFDEYLVYRPELLTRWESGQDSDWQADLWRALVGTQEVWHPARAHTVAIERLQSGNPWPESLPGRLAIFGVSVLPPRYLSLFAALADRIEVTLYLLQPTPEYWGDLVSARQAERQLRRAQQAADASARWHFERGPRLLTTFGRQGQEFLNTLLEFSPQETEADACFVAPSQTHLLGQVQSDLLTLTDRARGEGATAAPRGFDDEDTSIQVHACHSPQRELEVLHDQMLSWFQNDPSLSPEDVLVMTPNIEAYAPFIHAIWGHPSDADLRIPYSVADRSPRAAGQLAEAFLNLLQLPTTRMTVTQMLSLVDCRAWQRRFGFGPEDLPTLRDWVRDLNVSWGLDAAHRASLGAPGWAAGTWRQSADALLLGHALAPVDQVAILGLAPHPGVEGSHALLAGRWAEWIQTLETFRSEIAEPRTPLDWMEVLASWLTRGFAESPDEASEFAEVRAALRQLRDQVQQAGPLQPVSWAQLLEAFAPLLDAESNRGGFLRGGVTFCALKPMRAIPARVIAILGLNDGEFPRRTTRMSFDRIATEPREGDAARGTEDRFLFLETLLCARDRLYLSYVGQSARDNTPRPPSVVVSELLDYLSDTTDLGPAGVAALKVEHPLQPFSHRYFDGSDPRLFSYSLENLGAGRALGGIREEPSALRSKPLPEPGPEWREVRIEDLASFFCHPAKFFLRRRLQLVLPGEESPPADRERFELAGRDRYLQKQTLTEMFIASDAVDPYEAWLKAGGWVPVGAAGELECRALRAEVHSFATRVRAELGGGILPPTAVDLAIGPFRISGQLDRRTAMGLRHYRCAQRKATDELRLWVEHLCWNAVEGVGQSARLIAVDGCWEFLPVAEAEARLEELLAAYWKGLQSPLPFFPRTSQAWQEAEAKGKRPPEVVAQSVWIGTGFEAGEREDPYVEALFRDVDAVASLPNFPELARTVWTPLRNHFKEVEP